MSPIHIMVFGWLDHSDFDDDLLAYPAVGDCDLEALSIDLHTYVSPQHIGLPVCMRNLGPFQKWRIIMDLPQPS